MIETEVYYYKGKPYRILMESRLKARGVFELFGFDWIEDKYFEDREWVEVVIYETLYENPDGRVWVREKEQFFKLFKKRGEDMDNHYLNEDKEKWREHQQQFLAGREVEEDHPPHKEDI
jgi:hypothetical protein